MTISLGNAITRLGQEPKVVKKVIGLGLILFLVPFIQGIIMGMLGFPTTTENLSEEAVAAAMTMPMFVAFLMTLPVWAYVTGFLFQSMHKTFNSDRFQMVEFSQKNLLVEGIKNFFSMVGYFILVEIIMLVAILLLSIAIAIVVLVLNLILSAIFGPAVASILTVVLALAVGIVFGLYITQFINAAFTCYLKTLKFSDLIAFNKHFNIIKKNKHASWSLIGKGILFSLLYMLVIVVLCATLIGVVLLPFVVVMAYFVAFNLLDQYAKEIQIEKYL